MSQVYKNIPKESPRAPRFFSAAEIKASFQRAETAISATLGTVGTTGINAHQPLSIDWMRPAAASIDTTETHPWQKEIDQRRRVVAQSTRIFEHTEKKVIHYATSIELAKGQARLDSCGRSYLVEKVPGQQMKYLHSYHCKQKFCPRCRRKKVDRWAARFSEFFESETDTTLGILKDYDLAVLTVTLKHNRHDTRRGWYFDELKEHYRNAIKYGAFFKYIKASLYSTEVTHGSKGFHIHRHAIVLIPKEYGMRDGASAGNWRQSKKGKWTWKPKDLLIRQELRSAWIKRTGDSYNVDIRPFNSKIPMVKNLREVLKYIEFDEKGTVSPEIVEQIVTHRREKWTGRTGIFYKIPELALNSKDVNAKPKTEPNRAYIYIGVGLMKKGKGFGFQRLVKLPESEPNIFKTFVNWQGVAEQHNRNRLKWRHEQKINSKLREEPPPEYEFPY